MPPMGKGPGGKKMPGGGPKPKNMKKTLGTLLRYLGKYKVFLAIVLVLVVFNSFAMVAGSYFLKPLVNNYILPGDFAGLAKMLMVLGSIFLAGALSAYGYARIMVHVSQNTIRDIRRDLFNKMQDLPIKYFDRNTHGDLMSLYTNDIDMVVSVVEAQSNPYYNCFEQDTDSGFLHISKGDGLYTRRQDAPKAWEYNGAVYVLNPESLRHMRMGKCSGRVPYEMPRSRSVDLDTPTDWIIAEIIFKQNIQ